MLTVFTVRLIICVILLSGATACFKGNSGDSPGSEKIDVVNSEMPIGNAGRLDEKSTTILPPSPDTLTAALARKRRDKIEPVSASEIFHKDDGVKLKISAVKPGFVTVYYRGSSGSYLRLFPHKSFNQGVNSIAINQVLEIPDRGWFFFDEKAGTETVFIVYSESAMPEDLSREPKENISLLEKLQSENKNADVFVTDEGNLVRTVKLTHE